MNQIMIFDIRNLAAVMREILVLLMNRMKKKAQATQKDFDNAQALLVELRAQVQSVYLQQFHDDVENPMPSFIYAVAIWDALAIGRTVADIKKLSDAELSRLAKTHWQELEADIKKRGDIAYFKKKVD